MLKIAKSVNDGITFWNVLPRHIDWKYFLHKTLLSWQYNNKTDWLFLTLSYIKLLTSKKSLNTLCSNCPRKKPILQRPVNSTVGCKTIRVWCWSLVSPNLVLMLSLVWHWRSVVVVSPSSRMHLNCLKFLKRCKICHRYIVKVMFRDAVVSPSSKMHISAVAILPVLWVAAPQ